MSTDIEQQLAAELRRRAEATTTSPTAEGDIRARAAALPDAGTNPPAPLGAPVSGSWRRPVAALAAAVILLAVAVVAVERGNRRRSRRP